MALDIEKVRWDAGSFRDPAGRVFFCEDEVYRTVKPDNIGFVKELFGSAFFKRYVDSNQIIPTSLEKSPFAKSKDLVLKHKKIDFIVYPYEMSFLMLKEAALLTLEIIEAALKEGFILKDGSAWNVTYHEGKMCFFDVLSFAKYREGQLWEGYKQFCEEFLYPLMLVSYKKIDFQPFFKGNIKGIPVHQLCQNFKFWDLFKPGVFKHIFLNAKLSANKAISNAKVSKDLKVSKPVLLAIVKNLQAVVSKLKLKNKESVWSDYTCKNTYTEDDSSIKGKFITNSSKSFRSIIDIGCNTGDYSFQLPKKAKIYSCDLDSNCIDALFLRLKEHPRDITPFVLDLMNPSAGCGWALSERRSIFDRLQVEGFLALALVHHICIGSNVPIPLFLNFLSGIALKGGVIEWVDKSDPMVQFLLRNREDIFEDYRWDFFYAELQKRFKVLKFQKINKGTRTLCFVKVLA